MTDSLITVCMIVKNEEESLGRALTSAARLTGDIVVVDTGSTDGTIEIAEAHGAKVFHHPWEDDFSKARNQALGHAEGEWCFILDADEEIEFVRPPAETKDALLGVGPWQMADCGFVEMVDFQNGVESLHMSQPRILRRGRIHYEGSVHNEVTGVKSPFAIKTLRIHHYGFDLSAEKKAAKFERTHGLILKRLEAEPDWKEAYFYLAQICGQHGREEECIEWTRKYISHRDELGERFAYTIYWSYTRTLWSLGRQQEALDALREGLRAKPKNLDLLFSMAEFSLLLGDNATVGITCRSFISEFFRMRQGGMPPTSNTYTYTDECLCNILYWLATLTLSEGHTAIKMLRSGDYRLPEGLAEEVERIAAHFGVGGLILPGIGTGICTP